VTTDTQAGRRRTRGDMEDGREESKEQTKERLAYGRSAVKLQLGE